MPKYTDEFTFYEDIRGKYDFYVCATVVEELASIPDEKKEDRIKYFVYFAQIEAKFLPDSAFIWGYSRWGLAKWGAGSAYSKILNENKSNIKDAIIADTAVSNECILLTNDKCLYNKMRNADYKVMTFEELKSQEINNDKEIVSNDKTKI